VFGVAYGHFLNDARFLLMPLRMFEPGVHRTYDGTRKDSCDRVWDLIKLTFDDMVGLPAHDTYWMWVGRDTGLIEEWDFKTPAVGADQPPMRIRLSDYGRFGDVLLSARRTIAGPGQAITFTDIKVLPEVPKGAMGAGPSAGAP